jgi:fused-like protein
LIEVRHGEDAALACVIACASDDDGAARKFACFALGNAAFHSSDMYAALESGARPLCACLAGDADEKTRANAAGALGNLARNGGALAASLVAAGAPQTLVAAARNDAAAAPRRIALFSLGTLAAWNDVRRVLEAEPLRASLREALAAAEKSSDATQRKYSARVRSKLAAPASDTVGPG